MRREIIERARRVAEQCAGGSAGWSALSEEQLRCLDIGVRCGIAATLDALGLSLKTDPDPA
ncbi:hypothetical protein GCM10023317_04900 [Actinopolymorpha pittospori]|uniref:Uncharacterized protein n=1 Tax=Actinopolymorpha pittospori TaxID=648752 RepID=A0A927MTU5_9ACTN|nr:hypothetical protein [Actinopolymorpha pittospori]